MDEILNLTGSVSEGFSSLSCKHGISKSNCAGELKLCQLTADEEDECIMVSFTFIRILVIFMELWSFENFDIVYLSARYLKSL